MKAVRYLAVSAEVRDYRSIAPSRAGDNECDRAREKETMAFQQFTKFVADLNPGYCPLINERQFSNRLLDSQRF
jgi:hypothetical protein